MEKNDGENPATFDPIDVSEIFSVHRKNYIRKAIPVAWSASVGAPVGKKGIENKMDAVQVFGEMKIVGTE